ncbi:hypothetical protein AAMO2058_000899100 [Amorphochlora amoebiformis]
MKRENQAPKMSLWGREKRLKRKTEEQLQRKGKVIRLETIPQRLLPQTPKKPKLNTPESPKSPRFNPTKSPESHQLNSSKSNLNPSKSPKIPEPKSPKSPKSHPDRDKDSNVDGSDKMAGGSGGHVAFQFVPCCVFVRGLPSYANEKMIREGLSAYGKHIGRIRKILITRLSKSRMVTNTPEDIEGGLSAFVYLDDKVSVQAAVRLSRRKKIVIGGSQPAIFPAISKDFMRFINAKREGGKIDYIRETLPMRNNRLTREMTIPPDRERLMSTSDQIKRKHSLDSIRLALLDKSKHLSDCRLVVRNIPRSLATKEFKKMCRDACILWSEHSNPRILHAKILTDKKRVDSKGQARSRGVGFIQFDAYQDAVNCLRCLNNHPNPGYGFTSRARPIVEFAVEDGRVIATRGRKIYEKRKMKIMLEEKDMKYKNTLSGAPLSGVFDRAVREPEKLFEEMGI